MKIPRSIFLLVLSGISLGVSAATFDVTTPAEFQAALTTAQSNGEDDTINVDDGTYDIETNGTLTYTAAATEAFSLSILGSDSTFVILDGETSGGLGVPILRIDTTAVTNGDAVGITVTNMTFQDGYATGPDENADGGALFIRMGSGLIVQITGSEFYGNTAEDDGGAIYVEGNILEGIYLGDLTIDGNRAIGTSGEPPADGGGAYIAGGFSTPVDVVDIFFWDNFATGKGGGLAVEGVLDGDPVRVVNIYDVEFDVNQAQISGGGASVLASDVWVDTTGFFGCPATDIGGGLYLRDNSRLYMKNSGFFGNSATNGGGLGTDSAQDSGIVLEHNTLVANSSAAEGGGAYVSRGGSTLAVSFYNNIIWLNTGTFGADLYVDDDPFGLGGIDVATVELYNNDYTAFTTTCELDTNCTEDIVRVDNINVDPMLEQPSGRLMQGSPAIDAGLNNGHPSYPAIVVDWEFDMRPFDGDGDGTATVDIGADEYTGVVSVDADLGITKSDSPDPVLGGQNLTYTITVTNDGPDAATGVTMTDTLPSSIAVTFVSATPSQGTCTELSDVVTCSFGDIANGANASVVIEVTTPVVGVDTFISNSASVTATQNDSNPSNNSITEATTVVPLQPDQADLAVTLTDTPDPVFSGGPQVTWDITLTNNGPDGAEGIVLTHTVPVEVTDAQVTPPTGSSCGPPGPSVTCQIAPLALDESVSMSIVATPLTVTTATPISFVSEVTSVTVDPVAGNNSVTETTTVNPPEADMMVSVTASSSDPSIDEQVTFTITITNDGPSDNTNVVLELTLPAEGVAQSLTPSQGTCKGMSGTVTCFLGDMDAGGQATITYVVIVPSFAVEMLMSALVSGDAADPTTGNDTAAATINVIEAIELVIHGVGGGSGSLGLAGLLGLLLAVVLAAVPAGQTRAESPWYVGAAIGEANADYSAGDLTSDLGSLGWTITDVSTNDSDTAWKVYGGFMFNENFAVELGFVELGEVKTRYTTNIPPSDVDSILSDTYAVHPYLGNGWVAAGVYSLPFADEQWAFLARAGAFFWKADIDVAVLSGATGSVSGDDSGTDLMYGIGLEWKAGESFSITGEWERYRLNDWVDVPTIGFRWYFE
ncbi:MAG: outer membrane beta-barrel protein [Woeseiaceae bacterium]|nr:outer membrane beta-barrel protein [Woeseiaceae bacterium]